MDVMAVVNQISAKAPVRIGQVLCADIAGTDASLVVTRDINR